MSKESIVKMCSGLLGAAVSLAVVVVWAGERLDGKPLSIYDWFPLLGLVAFSLMWTHYSIGSIRRYADVSKDETKAYSKITSGVVLVCLLLHPGLLIFQLQADGFGLPPESYFAVYAEPMMKGAIMLGTLALIIFLLFEGKRWLQKKSWWRYIEYAQIAAMGLIFYHGLTLGRELSVGWYRTIWYFYGLSLVSAVFYNYWYDRSTVDYQKEELHE